MKTKVAEDRLLWLETRWCNLFFFIKQTQIKIKVDFKATNLIHLKSKFGIKHKKPIVKKWRNKNKLSWTKLQTNLENFPRQQYTMQLTRIMVVVKPVQKIKNWILRLKPSTYTPTQPLNNSLIQPRSLRYC